MISRDCFVFFEKLLPNPLIPTPPPLLIARAALASYTCTRSPPASVMWGVVRVASKTAQALRPFKPFKPKKLARAYACFLLYVARKVLF